MMNVFSLIKVGLSALCCAALLPEEGAQATNSQENITTETDLSWISPADELIGFVAFEDGSDAEKPDVNSKLIGLELQLYAQHFSYDIAFGPAPTKGTSNVLRSVVDFRRTFGFEEGFRFTLSNRLDFLVPVKTFEAVGKPDDAINVFREAYFSFNLGDNDNLFYFDIGRINIRNGVGFGYNPTDFFKNAAVVTSTTQDPGALRLNRLGVVMASAQHVARWGTVSFAAIPKIKGRDQYLDFLNSRSSFDLDFDRTNANNALFLKIAPQISEYVSVDLLSYLEEGSSLQTGMNISALLSDSIVANLESTVLRTSALPAAGQLSGSKKWFGRAVLNVVWTTPLGLELTAEVNYAGDALGSTAWQSYRNATEPADIAQFINIQSERSFRQEPLTQTGYFIYASWRDAFQTLGLSLSGFITGNFYDESFRWQATFSKSFDKFSVNALVNGVSGSPTSEYGGSSLKNYIALFISKKF